MNQKPCPPEAERDRQAGMALAETVTAFAILGIVVLALLQTQVSNLKVTDTSNDLSVATTELQACMEQALSLGVVGILAPGSPFARGQPVAAYQNRMLRDQSIVTEFPGYTAGDPPPAALVIRQTITWTDSSDHSRSLVVATACGS